MREAGAVEEVGERALFAPDDAPFPVPAPTGDAARTVEANARSWNGPIPQSGEASPRRSKPGFSNAWLAGWTRPSLPSLLQAIRLAFALELDRGIAFLFAPVFLAVGAYVYFGLGHEPGFAALGAVLPVLGLGVFLARTRPVLKLAITAILLCVVGALLAKVETWRAATQMLGGEISTTLSGRVVAIERLANGRVRLTVDVTGTERPALRYAPERIRVTARRIPKDVTAGSVISGLVRLMPPSGPVRPGSYDFSFERYFDGIGASGFFMRGPELALTGDPMPPIAAFRAAVERFRLAVAERISSHIGGAEGEIAAALVVGLRAGIPEDINEAMRRTGIYHVISISGLHMALVAGTIMGLLRAGFALAPGFSSRHPVKKYAAALALAGLAGYLFISGAEVAAQRSFIMLAVMLVAVLFDRSALTLRNLAISAIVVIVISPHEVIGPSFQMSFAATAALVGAYSAWSDWRSSRMSAPPAASFWPYRLVRAGVNGLAGLAVTSIVAGGATLIYAAWHFQQMPSLGLFTNLTAMPIVSVVVMPFAVLGSLAMPFGIDGPFFHVMGFGLTAMIAIARWFAERSTTDMTGIIAPVSVMVLTVALLVATLTSTWLRIFAVPIALAGLFLLPQVDRPDLLVSEDGRLVGLDAGEGSIAVNRARADGFTLQNWQRALRAHEVLPPEGRLQKMGETAQATGPDGNRSPSGRGFSCGAGACVARHHSGALVALAMDARSAADLCAAAAVIVLDDPSVKNLCARGEAFVITTRDLALNGSAAIMLSGPEGETTGETDAKKRRQAVAKVIWAVERPYRPWHEHRSFSRAARGLAPYEQKRNPNDSQHDPEPAKDRSAGSTKTQPSGGDIQVREEQDATSLQ